MPSQEELRVKHEHLELLLNTAPDLAIEEARKLPDDDVNWRAMRASILCDAGSYTKNREALQEAIVCFRSIWKQDPGNGQHSYNLANAISSITNLDRNNDDWFSSTSDFRCEARALYGDAFRELRKKHPRVASQAMTNLANLLNSEYRWFEAYECYQTAIDTFSKNGMASGAAARMLFWAARSSPLSDPEQLVDIGERLAHHAKSNLNFIHKVGGPGAVDVFKNLNSRKGGRAQIRLKSRASKYEKFVAEYRLALSPVIEGLGAGRKRWDDALIVSVSTNSKVTAVPEIFTMFNMLKSDYLVARRLLFEGINIKSRDSGFYIDTLDYSTYGIQTSKLILAQRAALDVLDKLAVAINHYFSVGLEPREIYFHTIWKDRKSKKWNPAIKNEIDAGNGALHALSEISADLTGGFLDEDIPRFLSKMKQARHAGTHRFTVLHDLKIDDFPQSDAIEHYDLDDFKEIAIRTVQIARAALLYFLEALSYAERRRPNGRIGLMEVYPHHWIRGE